MSKFKKSDEKEGLFKVVKVYNKSYRHETLQINLSKDEAMRMVNSFPNSKVSMVCFYLQSRNILNPISTAKQG